MLPWCYYRRLDVPLCLPFVTPFPSLRILVPLVFFFFLSRRFPFFALYEEIALIPCQHSLPTHSRVSRKVPEMRSTRASLKIISRYSEKNVNEALFVQTLATLLIFLHHPPNFISSLCSTSTQWTRFLLQQRHHLRSPFRRNPLWTISQPNINPDLTQSCYKD